MVKKRGDEKKRKKIGVYSGVSKFSGEQILPISPIFKEFLVPEMARLSWMAKKFTRGMTYQWKAKDLANAREYLYGVANVVI